MLDAFYYMSTQLIQQDAARREERYFEASIAGLPYAEQAEARKRRKKKMKKEHKKAEARQQHNEIVSAIRSVGDRSMSVHVSHSPIVPAIGGFGLGFALGILSD